MIKQNVLLEAAKEDSSDIINYVRENGDIKLEDMVDTEPFSDYDLSEMFGVKLQAVVGIVKVLHDSVVAVAA